MGDQIDGKLEGPTITLELNYPGRALAPDSSLENAVRLELLGALAEALEALGIPGEPAVRIAQMKDTVSSSPVMRVTTNGSPVRYPGELLEEVYSYVRGVQCSPKIKPAEIITWLSHLIDDHAKEDEVSREAVEFLSVACVEIVKTQPSLLLGPSQAEAYIRSLTETVENGHPQLAGAPIESDWLVPILRSLLELRISISDTRTVAEAAQNGLAKHRSRADVTEDLICLLRPSVIEIQLSRDYLKKITTADSGSGRDRFAEMRRNLYSELGLNYPGFKFTITERMKDRGFRFKLNHLTTLPRMGLQPGESFVLAPPTALSDLNVEKRGVVDPANRSECSIIESSSDPFVEGGQRVIAWNQIGYLAICLHAELLKNGGCFLDRVAVASWLEKMQKTSPALVKAVELTVAVEPITAALRALLAEEISIRNLKHICERIVDYDYVVTDTSKYFLLDDRIPLPVKPGENEPIKAVHLASFIRIGLKRNIGLKYTSNYTRRLHPLNTYLDKIQSEYQSSGKDGEGLAVPRQEQIAEAIEALQDIIEKVSATGGVPVIMAATDSRDMIRDRFAAVLPSIPVLSYQELPPNVIFDRVASVD